MKQGDLSRYPARFWAAVKAHPWRASGGLLALAASLAVGSSSIWTALLAGVGVLVASVIFVGVMYQGDPSVQKKREHSRVEIAEEQLPRLARKQMIGISLLVATAGTVALVVSVMDVLGYQALADDLRHRGQSTSGTVTEIIEHGKTGQPIAVEVKLPDGRETEVDLVDSGLQDVKTGEVIQLRVDPADISRNETAAVYEQTKNGLAVSLLSEAGYPIFITASGLLVAGLAWRRRRSLAVDSEETS